MHDDKILDDENILLAKFQNRKRYGGMHDDKILDDENILLAKFQNRKRYGGMHDSTPCRGRRNATDFGLLESVSAKTNFRLRSRKILSYVIQKRAVKVELTPLVPFGKCFA